MAIEHIRLKNFKCFKEVDLGFAPITVLTGANSSGKSSLLYGILAVFQSSGFPFSLSPNGKYVDMGDFTELCFGHDRDSEVGIDIDLVLPDKKNLTYRTSWIYDQIPRMPILKALDVKSDYYELNIQKNRKYSLHLELDTERFVRSSDYKILVATTDFVEYIAKMLSKGKTGGESSATQFRRTLKEIERVKNIEFSSIESLDNESTGKGNEIVSLIKNQLSRTIELIGSNLNFISSFRVQPERTYYQKVKWGDSVGRYGENYIDQIFDWKSRRTKEYKELVGTLRELELLYWLTIRRFRGGRFEPRVATIRGGSWSSLADAGFGISQLLPILVADLQLGEKSTLLVAQPEIHLHPSVQASLSDYFINGATKKGKRYIIET
ncbi:MAG: AAA family ATPase, partial [Chloroflexi bacterium]|nr:AAA family ATPase [Chloroflexota bacterium]